MRISYNEAAYILNYKQNHKFKRYLVAWTLKMSVLHGYIFYEVECKIAWWFFILSYIPVSIITLLWCMWDSGIKEYELYKRDVVYCSFYENDSYYDSYCDSRAKRAKEIYDKHYNKDIDKTKK